MMSMTELFYGENEPIWVIGNNNSRQQLLHPVSPYSSYTQQADIIGENNYVNYHTQYATSAYNMQPAAAHAGAHAQFNNSSYMQSAGGDHEVINDDFSTDLRHADQALINPYMRSPSAPSAGAQEQLQQLLPASSSNYTDRRFVNPNYAVSPYSARGCQQQLPTENLWPQLQQQYYPRLSTPASSLAHQHVLPALNNQTAATSSTRHKNNIPPSLALKVPLCCQRCEERVKESLLDMDGVEGVLCDQTNQRVIVKGNVQPQRVLKRVKKIKKSSDFWQQTGTGFRSSNSNTYNPLSQNIIGQQPSYTESY